MNGFLCNHMSEYSYGAECPYRQSCPVRAQCPYCPHQHDGNMDYSMNMLHYQQYNCYEYPNSNMSPMEYGYQNNYPYNNITNLSPMEYDYQNIYPNSVLTNVEPDYYDYYYDYGDNQMYNNLGYICPNEAINSPWSNNRMYNPN